MKRRRHGPPEYGVTLDGRRVPSRTKTRPPGYAIDTEGKGLRIADDSEHLESSLVRTNGDRVIMDDGTLLQEWVTRGSTPMYRRVARVMRSGEASYRAARSDWYSTVEEAEAAPFLPAPWPDAYADGRDLVLR